MLITLIVIIILVAMFIGTYVLNNRTEKPIDVDIDSCQGCYNFECQHNPAHHNNSKEDKK
ncbi:MAG: hypothetical protein LBR40_05605 [Bacilli bacterium]|jgi:hypothetical protein|nr:hypothetical protein [Bacilli bacterium]